LIRIGDRVIRFCQKRAKTAMYLSFFTFFFRFLFYSPWIIVFNLGCAVVVLIAWIPILLRRRY